VKLVIICGDFPPVQSGEAGHALHLARAVAGRGIEVHVLTSAIAGVQRDPAFTVHPIIRRWSWSSAPRIAGFLRRTSPDAVLLLYLQGMYRSHAMMTFLPTIARAVIPRVKFITQFEHTGSIPHRHSILHRAVRRVVATLVGRRTVSFEFGTLLRDSDQIIALNEPQRLGLAEQWPAAASRMTLIPPPPLMRVVPAADGAARARGRALLGLRDDEIAVLYYGYMYPGKGIETLLQAMHIATRTCPNARLVVVGEVLGHAFSGDDPQGSARYWSDLHALVVRLGISDRVTWTGACAPDGDEGSLYMWAADLCVLPFDNGIQLNNSTFAAAASHELPVLTTRGAALESTFVHGENVWLCPPRDPDAMAAALRFLIENPGQRNALRAGARVLAREMFSWDRAVDRTLALIAAVPRGVRNAS
jgi:glycosyltransferase involved in cell wall biosynthesis